MSRTNRIIAILVGAVFAVLMLSSAIASFYTDALWFGDVGQLGVFWRVIGWEWAIGALFVAAAFAIVYVNVRIARTMAPRARMAVVGNMPPQVDEAIRQFRAAVEPRLKWVLLAVSVIAALMLGSGMSSRWHRFALALNRVSFGKADPQFGLDAGFYVFTLPALRVVVDWAFGALVLTFIITALVHFVGGAIRPWERLAGFAPHVKGHLSVLLGLMAIVKAADYWLRIYELNFSPRGQVTGASYTDVHAQFPAFVILIGIALITAALLIVNIRFRGWRLPLIALGLWVGASILVGGIFPAIIQQLKVEPNEVVAEAPYIARNITATRFGFALADVEGRPFAAAEDLTAADIKANGDTIEDVRLWDPKIVAQSYTQLQGLRPYYEFTDVDVDRYQIGNRRRQVLISAREMDVTQLPDQARNWVNEHVFYTHGYGVVMSTVSDATDRGQPRFVIGDIPPTGPENLKVKRNGIYFGERENNYVIVNASKPEFDYPVGEGSATTSYEGKSGVQVTNLLRRLAFAVRFGSKDLLFSPLITSDSKVLWERNVRQRLAKVAPWLTLESDPYAVLAGDSIKWVVDGYTISNEYPYSERTGGVNYIRNSVKAVVDAYDGSVTLYAFDTTDPLLQAWSRIFPGLLTDDSKMPESIRTHLRYPQGLFKIQAEVYKTYHITDPQSFYNKEDAWGLPGESTGKPMEPFYVLMRLPGETKEDFVMMLPFTPRNRANMIGWMAAKSDPADYGKRVVFRFPKQKVILGPEQVSARINQDPVISPQLTLWNQRGSSAIFGNMLVIPIDNSVVYIQPLFLQAEETAIPELIRVIVVYADKVAMETNLQRALLAIFGQAPAAPSGESTAGPTPSKTAASLKQADDLYKRAIEAQKRGDWAEYGRLIGELGRVLNELSKSSTEATPTK